MFLKSLRDGKILVLGSEFTRTEDRYYDVRGVIRRDGGTELRYMVSDNGSVDLYVDKDTEKRATIPRNVIEEGTEFVDSLLDSAGKSKSSKGTVPLTDSERDRLTEIKGALHIKGVSQDSTSKTDITLIVYDDVTKAYLYLPFSIKSFVGANPTLLNASKATNFVFRVGGDIDDAEIGRLNAMDRKTKQWVVDKTAEIAKKHGLTFLGVDTQGKEGSMLDGNLRLIDSKMPEIIAELLLVRYTTGKTQVKELTEIVEEKNPMGFEGKQPFYRYKVSEFLMAAFTGMKPSKLWNGYEEAHGGYIVVTSSRKILCFPLSNRDSFMDYLFRSTYLETGSTTRHEFAKVERTEKGVIYKLNLDVRFSETEDESNVGKFTRGSRQTKLF